MDEQAFHACYRRTAGPLRLYVTRVLGDSTHADDIVQEAYLRLLRMTSVPEDAGQVRALLFRIVSNLIVDYWRRQRREAAVEGQTLNTSERSNPGQTIIRRMDMRRVFEQLRPRDRQLLWLAHVEGATHQEIALALGLRPFSVRVLLLRARRKLAKLLKEHEPITR